jgi:hypothetical protein
VKRGSPLPRDYFGPARLARSLRAFIAVVDPGTGRVLVNDRVELEDGVAQSFLRDGRLTALAEDADGNVWIEALTLRLER